MHELARVARRRAALLQYERDERDPLPRYGEVVRAYATDDTEAKRLRALESFAMFPNAAVTPVGDVFVAQQLTREAAAGTRRLLVVPCPSGCGADALERDLRETFERFSETAAWSWDGHPALHADFER